ncbi:para-aminobenzoate synthase [Dichomitus squalens]|uniref:aminodeoxychorismate synthase n=1 Tax=Dichomitus squalens TaxID=114155 RepID=A0A4Q9N2B6_9APHY|nr:para-aminobenzoate synthase [Dichomitus squalens]
MAAPAPRLLLIDSYDSFTYNLASLCKRAIPRSHIHIVKNDALSTSTLVPLLKHFDAIVVGPGPGSPDNSRDIGIVKDVWHVSQHLLTPVFGVCLGLQSLAIEFGAQIKRLNVVKHGQVCRVDHLGSDIFTDVGDVHAVRYHSLHVDLPVQSDIVPLAWSDDAEDNGRVLMACKHRSNPFWAVQYHPESVCTQGGGEDVVRNFWRLASDWSSANGRTVAPWDPDVEAVIGPSWPDVRPEIDATGEERSVPVSTRVLHIHPPDINRVCEMLGVEDDSTDFVMLDSAASPGRFSIVGCLTPTSPKITYSVGDDAVKVQRGSDVTFEELGSLDIWAWLAAFMRKHKAHGGTPEVPFWGGLIGYLSYELGVQALSPLPLRPDSSARHPDVNLVLVERSIVIDKQEGKVYIQSIFPADLVWSANMSAKLRTLADPATDRTAPPAPKPPKPDAALPSPAITLPDRAAYIAKIAAAKEALFAGDSYELCVTAPTRVVAPKAASARARGTSSSWALYKALRRRNPAPHAAYVRLHPSTLVASSPERFLAYARAPDARCELRPIKGTVRKAPGVGRAEATARLAGSTKEVAENLMIVDLIRHDLHGAVGEDVCVRQFCAVEEYETVWQLVSVVEGRPDEDVRARTGAEMGWEVLRACLPPGSMTGAPKKRSVEILRELEGAERGVYSGVMGYADVGGGGDWAVIIRSCFKYDDKPMPPAPPGAGAYALNGLADCPRFSGTRHGGTNGRVGGNGGPPHTNGTASGHGSINGRDTNGHDGTLNGNSTFNGNGPLNGHDPHQASGRTESLIDEWTLGAGGAITALSDPVAEWEEMLVKVESVLPAFADLESF